MRWCWLLLIAGCYAPRFTTGAPCDSTADCPAQQVCATATRTCELEDACPGCADAMPDAGVTCWSAWRSGTVAFSVPRPISELNSAGSDANPSLADGDRVLYFGRSNEIYKAVRPDRVSAFGPPIVAGDLVSTAPDSRVSISGDGRIAVLASQRTGGPGLSDLFYATRADPDGVWQPATLDHVGALNDAENQFDPELTPDGLRLYFATTPLLGAQVIVMASRSSLAADFDPPVVVSLSGASTVLADVTVSPDETVIMFASGTSGATTDIYVATRASRDVAFAPAHALTALNTPEQDADLELASDGCSFIFSSNRAGAMNRDLYVVDVVPQ